MQQGPERQINIPGIVNGIPQFSFTIPVFLPANKKEEESNKRTEVIEDYVAKIIEPLVESQLDTRDNDIQYSVIERPVFGAGDFLVRISVHKKPIRKIRTDYYEKILNATRDISHISQLNGFKTAKKFLVEKHAVDTPPPLMFAA